jgi:transcriptional regulator with XRE-family HTH domain
VKQENNSLKEMPTTYPQIAQEILKRIRGSRTQIETSRILGFHYNQYHKWESGDRQIKWDQFIMVCEAFQVQIEGTLRYMLLYILKKFDPANAPDILSQFLKISGRNDLDVLARRLHTHQSSIRRWLNGSVMPDLGTVLQFFDLEKDFLDAFIRRIFEVAPGEATYSKSANIEEARLQFFSFFPWGLVILAALEVQQFQNLKSEKLPELARFVGIDNEILKMSLSLMVRLGIVEIEKECYQLKIHFFNLNNLNKEELVRPCQYWTEKIDRRMKIREMGGGDRLPPKTLLFSDYRMVSITKESEDLINAAMAEFIGKVKAIHENQKGPREKVACLLIHHYKPELLPLDDDFDFKWLQTRREMIDRWLSQLES